MKILHLFSNWKWTGPAELAVNLARELATRHEVRFIAGSAPSGDIPSEVAKHAEERGLDLPTPLPRMTYAEAMERFGHDAPDLRFGLELVDCTDLAAEAGRLPDAEGLATRAEEISRTHDDRMEALFATLEHAHSA